MTGLTIIVPTLGRPNLDATLASIAEQVRDGDRVIVVAGGQCTLGHDIWRKHWWTMRGRALSWEWRDGEPDGCWGHGQRNRILDELEPGTPVCTIDDDDVYLPGALDVMRAAACDKPVVFRMTFGPNHPAHGLTVWQWRRLQFGDVGTPMILAPACTARFGLEYHGDFTYAQRLTDELGEPIWRDEVTVLVRPNPVYDPPVDYRPYRNQWVDRQGRPL